MRLTCPRCAAQYQIADAAIPPAGREVECSSCGQVWHQEGPGKSGPGPAAAPEQGLDRSFDPGARPVLNRALDESVLSILREEAARELRVRKGEPPEPAADHIPATEAGPAAETAAESGPESAPAAPEPQIDWPATTLTVSEAEAEAGPEAGPEPEPEPKPAPAKAPRKARAPEPTIESPAEPTVAAEPRPEPEPEPEPVLPALPDAAELAATLTRAAALPEPSPAPPPEIEAARTALRPAEAEPRASAHAAAAPVPAVVADARGRSGYGAGFGLAAMLALGLVAVYALAPQLPADRGGALLAEWRQGIDQGRLWLHARILGD